MGQVGERILPIHIRLLHDAPLVSCPSGLTAWLLALTGVQLSSSLGEVQPPLLNTALLGIGFLATGLGVTIRR